MAVSDGSFKLQRGASAAIIEGRGNQHSRALIANRVPGRRTEHSPYRTEVAGVFGIVTYVLRIAAKYKITSDSIRVGLDGQAVVEVLQNINWIQPSRASYDLFQGIKGSIDSTKIDFEFFWVEGHQDEKYKAISYEGHLNIACDSLAKTFWNETKGRNNH